QLAPAIEILSVDDAFRAHRHHEIMLAVVGYNADGMGARRRAELHGEGTKASARTPHKHVLSGRENVRAMAEQHTVGRRKSECVAGTFFPRQVLRTRHELLRLH